MFTVMATFIISCGDSPKTKIETAERLLNAHPDSAYMLLREVDYNNLDSDSLKAKYILTKAITNLRVGRSLITDTLLTDAAAYYLSKGDTTNWVIASQLLSGYDFIKGDPETAMDRLERMLPLIKNRELLWDTHMNLTEISLNGQMYPEAYTYSDWLLNHTNLPDQILKFGAVKGASKYMQGDFDRAAAIFDSIIATGITDRATPGIVSQFYCDYAEILDGAGRPAEAAEIVGRLNEEDGQVNDVEKVSRMVSLAQFYANSGNIKKAETMLDSINHDATRSVIEAYLSIGMLKAAIQFKETGRFPSEMMRKITKDVHRSYTISQYDRQTALESVIELNEDNYDLKLQKQRLWLSLSIITLIVLIGGGAVYMALNRRKQRLADAEERAETLAKMIEDVQKPDNQKSRPSDSDMLKAALLRQLGIFKTFAGTPTQQSRDALKRISNVGNNGESVESLVDWPVFYSMIDSLYDGFHSRLTERWPGTFNDKEQQIIVLLKAGFSTKEISVLTEQSSATIYVRKTSIRKKLQTPGDGDFIAQLDTLFSSDEAR